MIWGVVGFLVVIGLLVFISTIGSKNDFINNDEMNDDICDKADPNGLIDFRESTDIPNDLQKLRIKINQEQDSYKASRKMIIVLSVLAIIIIAGIFVILPLYIRDANNKLTNNDKTNESVNNLKTTKDIYDEINNTISKNTDGEDDNKEKNDVTINYEKLNVKEKNLYKNATLLEELVNKETIVKNFTYAESVNNQIEFILIDKEKNILKFSSSSDMNNYLSNEDYLNANFEKRFVLNDNGLVDKYIYTYKN